MKPMKELEAMSDAEITAFIEAERATAQTHRFGIGGRDVKASRTAKKNVARALTVLTARNTVTTT